MTGWRPSLDVDDVRIVNQRLAVVAVRGHDRQGDQHVQGGQAVGGAADALRPVRHLFADLLEQRVLQLADAVLGPQHLLLVVLQLFGDEALGIGQGLAADVIGRDSRQVALGDLDGVAEDPVVADLEGRDAGAGLFLGLQAGDEALALAADGAQFVQFGVVAGSDDAPLAQGEGGGFDDAVLHQVADVCQRIDGDRQCPQQRALQRLQKFQQGRELTQGVQQGPQVASAGRGHADAAVEAFQVGDAPQPGDQRVADRRCLQQLFDRIQTLADRLQSDQRVGEPLLEAAGTHGGAGPVQAAQQRAALPAVGHAGGDLQVAAGGRVQGQMFGALVDADVADMGDGRFAVLPQVIQGCAGRHQAGRHLLQSQGLGRCGAELAAEQPGGIVAFIDPSRAAGDHPLCQGIPQFGRQDVLFQAVAQQNLPGIDADRFRRDGRSSADLGHAELAGGEVQPGHAPLFACSAAEGQQVVVLVRREALGFDQQAGGDHPDHLAPDDALGLLRVFHLFADGHLVAGLDQPGDIGCDGVIGDAAEGDLVAAALVAGGQGDIEDAGCQQGVVQEHLVKVPHAEKEDRIGIARLDLQVLPHHGGLFCHVDHAFQHTAER